MVRNVCKVRRKSPAAAKSTSERATLGDDQALTEAPRASRELLRIFLQSKIGIFACRAPCRRQAEEHAGRGGDRCRGGEHAHVRCEVQLRGRVEELSEDKVG